MRHLLRMAAHSSHTNMHARNLAIVWAPNLLRSKDIEATGFSGTAAFMEVRVQSIVVEFILTHVEQLFGDAPLRGSETPRRSLLLGGGGRGTGSPRRTTCRLRSARATAPPIRPYHTIIELSDHRRKGSLKAKKWRSIFHLGRSSHEAKRKLAKEEEKDDKCGKITLRPAKSMDSLSSVPFAGDDNPRLSKKRSAKQLPQRRESFDTCPPAPGSCPELDESLEEKLRGQEEPRAPESEGESSTKSEPTTPKAGRASLVAPGRSPEAARSRAGKGGEGGCGAEPALPGAAGLLRSSWTAEETWLEGGGDGDPAAWSPLLDTGPGDSEGFPAIEGGMESGFMNPGEPPPSSPAVTSPSRSAWRRRCSSWLPAAPTPRTAPATPTRTTCSSAPTTSSAHWRRRWSPSSRRRAGPRPRRARPAPAPPHRRTSPRRRALRRRVLRVRGSAPGTPPGCWQRGGTGRWAAPRGGGWGGRGRGRQLQPRQNWTPAPKPGAEAEGAGGCAGAGPVPDTLDREVEEDGASSGPPTPEEPGEGEPHPPPGSPPAPTPEEAPQEPAEPPVPGSVPEVVPEVVPEALPPLAASAGGDQCHPWEQPRFSLALRLGPGAAQASPRSPGAELGRGPRGAGAPRACGRAAPRWQRPGAPGCPHHQGAAGPVGPCRAPQAPVRPGSPPACSPGHPRPRRGTPPRRPAAAAEQPPAQAPVRRIQTYGGGELAPPPPQGAALPEGPAAAAPAAAPQLRGGARGRGAGEEPAEPDPAGGTGRGGAERAQGGPARRGNGGGGRGAPGRGRGARRGRAGTPLPLPGLRGAGPGPAAAAGGCGPGRGPGPIRRCPRGVRGPPLPRAAGIRRPPPPSPAARPPGLSPPWGPRRGPPRPVTPCAAAPGLSPSAGGGPCPPRSDTAGSRPGWEAPGPGGGTRSRGAPGACGTPGPPAGTHRRLPGTRHDIGGPRGLPPHPPPPPPRRQQKAAETEEGTVQIQEGAVATGEGSHQRGHCHASSRPPPSPTPTSSMSSAQRTAARRCCRGGGRSAPSPPARTPTPRSRRRRGPPGTRSGRAQHNEVERRRRDKINNWIVAALQDHPRLLHGEHQVGAEQGRNPLQSLRLHPGAAAEQPPPLRGAAGPRPAPDGQRGLAAAGGRSEEQEPDPAGAAPPGTAWRSSSRTTPT
ncbi:unnamed protein product, partial [Bubo scandiacus]